MVEKVVERCYTWLYVVVRGWVLLVTPGGRCHARGRWGEEGDGEGEGVGEGEGERREKERE